MKIKHKKIHTAIIGMFLFAASILAPLVPAATTQALECGVLPKNVCDAAEKGSSGKVEDTGVWKLLLLVVNIMTAGVVILAIGGVVYAAVMYTSAGGNQEQVKKARTILVNAVIGILAFVLMYAVLQWLIPGGIFNGSGGGISA